MSALAKAVGLAVVGLSLAVGAIDGYHGAKNWSRMGPLSAGSTLPEFRVARLEGGLFTGADLEGKVSVLTFWATWCGVCRGELVDLDELDDRYVGRDVQFLAVNREGGGLSMRQVAGGVQRYKNAQHLELPFALDDGSMARELRVGPIPHTVVFDRVGTLRYVHQGRVSSDTIAEEIDALLAE